MIITSFINMCVNISAVPKSRSIFSIDINRYNVQIYGSNFCHRSFDRSKVKFKQKLIHGL